MPRRLRPSRAGMRARSPYWYAKYRDADGNTKRESMGTESKREARAKLDKIIAEIERPTVTFADVARAVNKALFIKVADRWLAEFDASAVQDDRKRRAHNVCVKHFGPHFGLDALITHIKPSDIWRYYSKRYADGARYNTVRIERQFLKPHFPDSSRRWADPSQYRG